VSGASLDGTLVPNEEPMASIHPFAAHQMMLSDALYALLRSLDRHEGAVNGEDVDAAAAQA
jgi:hypothetical protein